MKDNVNTKLDWAQVSAREELHLCIRENENSYKPKVKYTFSLKKSRLVCERLGELSLPNDIVLNLVIKLNCQTQSCKI